MKLPNTWKFLYCFNCGSQAIERKKDINQKNHGISYEYECCQCGDRFGWPVTTIVTQLPLQHINLGF